MQKLLIVSGMSGSGKTIALRTLEDLDFYCVDNLPIDMLQQFVQHISQNSEDYSRVSVGIDIRNSEAALKELPSIIKSIESSAVTVEVIFLNSDDKTLLKRYSETRRSHPLSNNNYNYSLSQAIKQERILLEPLAASADLLIDTSKTTAPQLRDKIWRQVSQNTGANLSLLLQSFAFKRGVPFDADFVFDARCLPNPFWEKQLREFCGKDKPIKDYLGGKDIVIDFYHDIYTLVEKWIPSFEEHDRSYLTIAIGCTGGKHRSVYLVEKLFRQLKKTRNNILVQHRELD
ncbi:RNase adapter protein RapZ [hydrothermal vent metagenome]|uniref:RNase adapter protein RapZ n=1 Tax=hydrothermal vent metagenome TaxID=652676 RepID=A0A3B0VP30_9ZZZZ